MEGCTIFPFVSKKKTKGMQSAVSRVVVVVQTSVVRFTLSLSIEVVHP